MDLKLNGKIALVLGGSQGIGRATALALAREGAQVAICGRDPDRLEAARALIAETDATVLAVQADVAKPEEVRSLVDQVTARFGTVHILVNNAAGPKPGRFDEIDGSDWEAAFHLTLMSAVAATRAVLPHMRRQRWGRVINISSYSVKRPIGELLAVISTPGPAGGTCWAAPGGGANPSTRRAVPWPRHRPRPAIRSRKVPSASKSSTRSTAPWT